MNALVSKLMMKPKQSKPPLADPDEIALISRDDQPRRRLVVAELAAIRERFERSEHRLKVAGARARGEAPTTSLMNRAAALLSGAEIRSLAPPADEASAAYEEMTILRAALTRKSEELEAIDGELGFGACKQFEPLASEALRRAYDAVAAELYPALEVGRKIRAKLAAAGYQVNENAIPIHLFPHAAALGDPTSVSTPAGAFRVWLESRGILR